MRHVSGRARHGELLRGNDETPSEPLASYATPGSHAPSAEPSWWIALRQPNAARADDLRLDVAPRATNSAPPWRVDEAEQQREGDQRLRPGEQQQRDERRAARGVHSASRRRLSIRSASGPDARIPVTFAAASSATTSPIVAIRDAAVLGARDQVRVDEAGRRHAATKNGSPRAQNARERSRTAPPAASASVGARGGRGERRGAADRQEHHARAGRAGNARAPARHRTRAARRRRAAGAPAEPRDQGQRDRHEQQLPDAEPPSTSANASPARGATGRSPRPRPPRPTRRRTRARRRCRS